jgi:hypothetical protein
MEYAYVLIGNQNLPIFAAFCVIGPELKAEFGYSCPGNAIEQPGSA